MLVTSFDVLTFRETNLKVRQPLPETHDLQEDVKLLSEFDGNYNCMVAKFIMICLKVMLNVNLQITDYTSLWAQ